jgi:hypothetical protein
LSFAQREEIAVLRAQGKSLRQIAAVIGRAPSEESILKYGGTNPLPGHMPISAELVAQTYLRSIAGIETGKTFTVGY